MPLTPPAEPGNNSDIYTTGNSTNNDQHRVDTTFWMICRLGINSELQNSLLSVGPYIFLQRHYHVNLYLNTESALWLTLCLLNNIWKYF